MASKTVQPSAMWALVRRQHGVISRRQLLAAGFSTPAIKHRAANGRLHRVAQGVYAVGRPELSRDGELMAAVLAAGTGAWISHETGAEALRVRRREPGPIEMSVVAARRSSRPRTTIHRRERRDPSTVTEVRGIPVTTVPALMVDMALRWPPTHLEAAINQADVLDLLDPEAMRRALDAFASQPGVKIIRDALDAATFLLTDSELERRFLRLVRGAGLPDPRTQRYTSGHRVDFAWDELGLVVETDGLRYHRTPFQQRRDLERDQAHRARGFVPVRFTRWQVRYARQTVLDGLLDGARLAEAARDLRGTG
jgi:very-short-patch-repair endonuclease